MITPDNSNVEFQLAVDFVIETNKSLFLTGKAGTGKTTFLKYIKEQTLKNTVVLAPTGVAAINAGGSTIHSFFQLPFGPFFPGTYRGGSEIPSIADKHSIFQSIHFRKEKIELLRELDMLIIDEVSMVRCDLMDAVDTVLRHYRRQPFLPFGGVQVILIGDLFQLPPVMPGTEWELLQEFYDSPYFFSSQVIKQFPPVYLELKKIYRQNEQHFINVLNRIRTNEVEWEDLELLHQCCQPDAEPLTDESYIMLSTHNRKVELINFNKLEKLSTRLFSFEGTIKGDFSEKSLPTDLVLRLKEGSQVMFIKNDTEAEKRYYNGKIARIKSLKADKIIVSFQDKKEELVLEKATWENISYHLNTETGKVEEKIEGTFTQYPVKLAWAITVHKSQGLTFEKAIVDLGSSFAPGQVYVALSRCTSLQGLVLHSRISRACIRTDPKVIEFSENELESSALEEMLREERRMYWRSRIVLAFQFDKIKTLVDQHLVNSRFKKNDDNAASIALAESLASQVLNIAEIALRFVKELDRLFEDYSTHENPERLLTRMDAAETYFSDFIQHAMIKPVKDHRASLKSKQKVKKYLKELKELEKHFEQKIGQMKSAKKMLPESKTFVAGNEVDVTR